MNAEEEKILSDYCLQKKENLIAKFIVFVVVENWQKTKTKIPCMYVNLVKCQIFFLFSLFAPTNYHVISDWSWLFSKKKKIPNIICQFWATKKKKKYYPNKSHQQLFCFYFGYRSVHSTGNIHSWLTREENYFLFFLKKFSKENPSWLILSIAMVKL